MQTKLQRTTHVKNSSKQTRAGLYDTQAGHLTHLTHSPKVQLPKLCGTPIIPFSLVCVATLFSHATGTPPLYAWSHASAPPAVNLSRYALFVRIASSV